MKKTPTCPISRRATLEVAFSRRPRVLLLSAVFLLAAACGDDFTGEVATTTDDEATASSATATTDDDTLPPSEPAASATSSGVIDDPTDVTEGTLSGTDGGTGPGRLPPPDDSDAGPAPGDCGGESQVCCEQDRCRAGLVCESGYSADAGDASVATCQRDGTTTAPAERDGGPPRPGMPPAPDGDAGPRPMPPAPDGDGGPRPMPPVPDGDAGPLDANCGAANEPCCAGRGGRCDEGLRCENPNGPDLSDSECLPEQ